MNYGRLMVLTLDGAAGRSHEEQARLSLAGGASLLQVRCKGLAPEPWRETVRAVMARCREARALCVVNDRVDIAKDLGADGAHLGLGDLPLKLGRALLGPAAILGATAHTAEQAIARAREGANYLGVGPFRFTGSKKNLAPLLGLEGFASLMENLRAAGVEIPVYAIGGILPEDVPGLLATGVHGVAVSSAVVAADDPVARVRRFLEALG